MNLIQIHHHINQQKNILFYNKDVHDIYKELKSDHLCVFFNDPHPIKIRLIECIETIVQIKEPSLKRFTTPELIKILFIKLHSNHLIILFNNFHLLNRRVISTFQELNRQKNISFICSFSGDFKEEVYSFYKTFELGNLEEYKLETGHDEINITYPVFFILGLLSFIVYLKAATDFYYMGTVIMSGIWFGFIVFRLLVFTAGRI